MSVKFFSISCHRAINDELIAGDLGKAVRDRTSCCVDEILDKEKKPWSLGSKESLILRSVYICM